MDTGRFEIDVDNLDVDSYIQYEKFRVQAFGLRCAIVFSFLTPICIYGFLFAAALCHVPLDLHEEHALYVCLGNFLTIIAFGFRGPSGVALDKPVIKGKGPNL